MGACVAQDASLPSLVWVLLDRILSMLRLRRIKYLLRLFFLLKTFKFILAFAAIVSLFSVGFTLYACVSRRPLPCWRPRWRCVARFVALFVFVNAACALGNGRRSMCGSSMSLAATKTLRSSNNANSFRLKRGSLIR